MDKINRNSIFFITAFTLTVTASLFSCRKNIKNISTTHRFENSIIKVYRRSESDSTKNYSIKITGNQRLNSIGGINSNIPGIQERKLEFKTINKLFNEVECSNFFDFHDAYGEESISDSNTIIIFEHRGFTKEVKIYSSPPEELQKIIELIEYTVKKYK